MSYIIENSLFKTLHIYRDLKSDLILKIIAVNVNVPALD